MSSKPYRVEEREAIAEHHGELEPETAREVARRCIHDKGREQAPNTWDWANRRWRAVVAEAYGQDRMDKIHEKLKAKHDVDSFKNLTAGQILDSAERIREHAL